MLDCPTYGQVILGYKLGYQRSNSLYHYCQRRKQSVSKLLKQLCPLCKNTTVRKRRTSMQMYLRTPPTFSNKAWFCTAVQPRAPQRQLFSTSQDSFTLPVSWCRRRDTHMKRFRNSKWIQVEVSLPQKGPAAGHRIAECGWISLWHPNISYSTT